MVANKNKMDNELLGFIIHFFIGYSLAWLFFNADAP